MTAAASTPRASIGLAEAEARARLRRFGPNALPPPPARGLARFAVEVLEEPVFLLLVAAAALYLALGDLAEGALMASCAGVSVALVAVQSWRSERVLRRLADLAGPVARAIRDGATQRVPASALVPGDAIVLLAGDRVPADAVLREAAGLVVDESALTGESVPVTKATLSAPVPPPDAPPGGDGLPLLFSGTLVLAGEGVAEVTATGARTSLGRIGAAVGERAWRPTPLQRALSRLVKRLALAAAAVAVALALLHGATRGDWIEASLAGITLAMSAMPEELPMVLAIFLAVGAWRLSARGVLARQPAAVLALGATTVLCLDKTGTLTENRIRLEAVARDDAALAPGAPAAAALIALAARACHPQGGDPMDRAVLALTPPPTAYPLREYPLSAARPLVAFAWPAADGVELVAKGAPEAVAGLARLDATQRARLLAAVDHFAARGLRVLALARAAAPAPPGDLAEARFELVGLLAFGDRLRDSAREAVAACREAGIAVAMITGDYPATARAIATEAGLDVAAAPLIGAQLATADATRIGATRIFARVLPEQKLAIVEAFAARGEVVAMTGDGVNDAPALRAAHVGIAMGGRATDVAREAAGLVVLGDDLRALPGAIAEGRRIADNLRKAIVFITAVHVPVVGLALLPLLVGWPLLLHPAHVIFLELIIDPICAVVFEATRPERGLMRRKPRPVAHTVGSRCTILVGLAQGAAVLVAVGAFYGASLAAGIGEDVSRGRAFLALIVANLGLAFTNLSWRGELPRSPAYAVAAGLTTLAALAVWGLAPARAVFHVAVPAPRDVALAIAVSAASVLWFELAKRFLLAR